MKSWLEEVEINCDKQPVTILVGNKTDLSDQRQGKFIKKIRGHKVWSRDRRFFSKTINLGRSGKVTVELWLASGLCVRGARIFTFLENNPILIK